jgi:uncharacterized protein VirK/YbjX
LLDYLGSSLDIDLLIGIGNERQLSKEAKNAFFFFNYDEFWKSFCASEMNGFYLRSLPFQEKPIDEINGKHRSRAGRRRELRNQIFESTRLSFNALVNLHPERPRPVVSNHKYVVPANQSPYTAVHEKGKYNKKR